MGDRLVRSNGAAEPRPRKTELCICGDEIRPHAPERLHGFDHADQRELTGCVTRDRRLDGHPSPRKHVGAVIVRDRTVLSTGYNGSIRGLPHCEDVGCVMEDGHCVTTVHAEANAILQAAKNGVSVDGGELYTTASPCWNCFKLIANAGIRTIYYGEFYRDERSRETAAKIGIELVDLQMPALK